MLEDIIAQNSDDGGRLIRQLSLFIIENASKSIRNDLISIKNAAENNPVVTAIYPDLKSLMSQLVQPEVVISDL